jgi:hypothetical protein
MCFFVSLSRRTGTLQSNMGEKSTIERDKRCRRGAGCPAQPSGQPHPSVRNPLPKMMRRSAVMARDGTAIRGRSGFPNLKQEDR